MEKTDSSGPPGWAGPPVAVLWTRSLVWGLLCMDTLSALEVPFRLLSASEICEDCLDAFRILIVPGGWAAHKVRALGETGRLKIAGFIDEGGSYIGFCGGAGLALSSPPRSLPYPDSQNAPVRTSSERKRRDSHLRCAFASRLEESSGPDSRFCLVALSIPDGTEPPTHPAGPPAWVHTLTPGLAFKSQTCEYATQAKAPAGSNWRKPTESTLTPRGSKAIRQ